MQDNSNLPQDGAPTENAPAQARTPRRRGPLAGAAAVGQKTARAALLRRAAAKGDAPPKVPLKSGPGRRGPAAKLAPKPATPRRLPADPDRSERASAIVAELRAADAEGRAPHLPPELLPGAEAAPPAEAAPEAELPAGQMPDPSSDPGQAGRHPPVTAAVLRLRHHVLMLSFLLVVVLPFVLAVGYLFVIAEDQYASTVGFTVRREEGATSSTELLGGLAQFAGSGGSSESDILYEYIQSQEIVASIDERLGLGQLYSRHWPGDPVMALWPDPTIEDLLWYWGRMVRISYDQSTRLIELRVLAFSPDDAQRIAGEIVLASQNMINDLNTQSRNDMMRYANEDLETALARLKSAREALSRFRTRTQIVDPAADMQGRMGVLNTLQQQLAEALIDNDIVLETTQTGDPRREQAARRIQVIRDRIAAERQSFASEMASTAAGETYPALMAEFESLTVDLQFAEETYRAALAAVDVARAKASRQSLYLAPYIAPTLPQTAEFPQRGLISGIIGLFLLLIWSIAALVYYSVRDRR